MSSTRTKFAKEFKLKVVQAYEAGASVASLTGEYDIHANVVYKWTEEYRNNPVDAFRGSADADHTNSASEKRVAELEQMVRRLIRRPILSLTQAPVIFIHREVSAKGFFHFLFIWR